MPHTFSTADELQRSIRNRWATIDWDTHFKWWRRPSKVRILMYADGSVHFSGGGFLGLQYVYNLLKSRSYFYVDFQIEFAHRDGTDPTATIPGALPLTSPALDLMNRFDEVWFFGINPTPNLTAAEAGRRAGDGRSRRARQGHRRADHARRRHAPLPGASSLAAGLEHDA